MWDPEQWLSPPVEFRGAPLWSWNGDIDPARLPDQIHAMHEGGLGGFFVHPRYGMQTVYLSDDYFDAVRVAYDTARSLGMKAYLYDEDRWPSGSAGGLVTRDTPAFQARFLLCQRGDIAASPDMPVVARFAATFEGDVPVSWSRLPSDAPHGLAAMTFLVRRREPSGFFNDGTYVDVMNPAATAAFLQVTHERYAKRWGSDFGDFIPAVFTDEPNYAMASFRGFPEGPSVPWTDRLPAEFNARRGYDLVDSLPELFFSTPGADTFSRPRADYYRTLTELFVESYTKPIGDWCAAHNLASSGHLLAEETLERQCRCVGACMPHYEFMHWPGIDLLSDQCDELVTAKQCTSVADQLARPRVLTETYGCTGWDWPLEGHKFTGDWQLATGVNFRCHHLVHYTVAGEGKRDCPASLSPHSPWWSHYKPVEDYFARLSWALTRGKPIRDVLVIHPIESAWGVFLRSLVDKPSPVRDLDAHLRDLAYGLSFAHRDWDFADESLLAKYGSVGTSAALAPTMQVGQMSYKVILIPLVHTLRASTVALLEKFQAAGGTIIYCGSGPERLDNLPNPRARAFTANAARAADVPAALAALDRVLPRRVSITEGDAEFAHCWAMLRDVPPGRVLFIQSHDRKAGHTLNVDVEGALPAVLHDPMTGTQRLLDASAADGRVRCTRELPPTGSALLTFGIPVQAAASATVFRASQVAPLAGPFDIELTEPNVFPLDFGRFRVIADTPTELSPLLPIAKGDQFLRDALGLGPRPTWGDIQPYARTPDDKIYGQCEVLLTFHATAVPSRCALAIERSELFNIEINGQPVPHPATPSRHRPADARPSTAPPHYWIDPDIHTVDITQHVRAGQNTVRLTFGYRRHFHMEDFHLVGDFGVTTLTPGSLLPGHLTLIAPPRRLGVGPWTQQALPFYGATTRYKTTFSAPAAKRVAVSLPALCCTSAALIVNGRRFVLPWAPFEAEITSALRPGQNDLVIELASGRRNSLGPIHTTWGQYTLPPHFDPTDPTWTDAYQLTHHGLLAPPLLLTS